MGKTFVSLLTLILVITILVIITQASVSNVKVNEENTPASYTPENVLPVVLGVKKTELDLGASVDDEEDFKTELDTHSEVQIQSESDEMVHNGNSNLPLSVLNWVTRAKVGKYGVFKLLNQQFENGDFELATLSGWNVDDSSQVNVITGDSHVQRPFQGTYMAMIGSDSDDSGQSVNINTLSQTIPAGVRSVGFYYNFFTTDVAPFDEPGMMVFVNDQQVQQIWARDINVENDESGKEYSSGWHHMNIYVGDIDEGTLTIAFYGGNNDADNTHQSWLYIDAVSTEDVVIDEHTCFDFQVEGQTTGMTTYYQIGNHEPRIGNTFCPGREFSEEVVAYWSSASINNVEPKQMFRFMYDDQAPAAITDLQVIDEGDGEYTLVFSAPADNRFSAVSKYDIRYSTTPIINEADWASSLIPQQVQANAPRYFFQPESLLITGLTGKKHYYFAIKSADAANNWSAISNIAETDDEPYVEIIQQDRENVQLEFSNVTVFDKAEYVLTYTHLVDGQSISESMTDDVQTFNQSSVKIFDLYLGTCSEAGMVCVPHQHISEVAVTVRLSTVDNATVQIECLYPDDWEKGM